MSSDGLYRTRSPPGRCHGLPRAMSSAKMLPSRVSSSPRACVGQFGTEHLASADRQVQRGTGCLDSPTQFARMAVHAHDSSATAAHQIILQREGSPTAIQGFWEGKCVRFACPSPAGIPSNSRGRPGRSHPRRPPALPPAIGPVSGPTLVQRVTEALTVRRAVG